MSRAHGGHLKNFKLLFLFFTNISKSEVVLEKLMPMPITNVKRFVSQSTNLRIYVTNSKVEGA